MKTTVRIQMVSIEMEGDAPEIAKALTALLPNVPPNVPPNAPKELPPKQTPRRKRATKVTAPNGQD